MTRLYVFIRLTWALSHSGIIRAPKISKRGQATVHKQWPSYCFLKNFATLSLEKANHRAKMESLWKGATEQLKWSRGKNLWSLLKSIRYIFAKLIFIQTFLRDMVGLVPDHCHKVNITIKWVSQVFKFSTAYKS